MEIRDSHVLKSFLLALLIFWGMREAQGETPAERGAQLFETHCMACHTIGKGKLVGPDLLGVTERRSIEWLRGYIKSPSSYFDRKDEIATRLLEEYSVPMPDLGLSDEDVEALIVFLGGEKKVEVGIPRAYYWTLVISAVGLIFLTLVGILPATKKMEV